MVRCQLSQAQFHSEQTSEKVKNIIKYKKSQGFHIGKIPYGFKLNKLNGKLIENKPEQLILKRINQLSKIMKAKKLVDHLNKTPKSWLRNTPYTYNRIKYITHGKPSRINTELNSQSNQDVNSQSNQEFN